MKRDLGFWLVAALVVVCVAWAVWQLWAVRSYQ